MSTVKTAYKESLAEDYDDKRFASPGGQAIHAAEMKILFKALAASKIAQGAAVAEVGCGTGCVLYDLSGRGYKITGVEPSEFMMGKAKERFAEGGVEGDFVAGTATEIPSEDRSFNFVYTVRVLNQTESRDYALSSIKELLRVAKPGGCVLVEFMNYHRRGFDRRRFRLGDATTNRGDVTNVRLTPSEVEKELRNCGAEIVWTKGIFFLGMTSYYSVPAWLLGLVRNIDGLLGAVLPRLCSRVYVLARKAQG